MLARFRPSPTLNPPRWLGHLASGLMLILLAWLCASIYWTISLPDAARPATTTETNPLRLAQTITAHHLFGEADPASKAFAGANLNTVSSSGELQLLGIIAAQRDQQAAYALIARAGSAPEVVREGDEFAPGMVLQRVLPHEVTLLRNGRSFSLSLPERSVP